MKETLTKQETVLKELWLSGKKERMREISKNTGLTIDEVKGALLSNGLLDRRLTIRTKEGSKSFFEFNDAVIPRIKTILGID